MIKVYKSEIEAGIGDLVKTSASIAYTQPLKPSNLTDELKSIASQQFADLGKKVNVDGIFATDFVLVSTIWNLNDDVFDPEEVWIARSTPVHKPSNINHIERDIIGHITSCYPIYNNLDEVQVIPEDTALDDLPEIYHLINSGVIYTEWEDKEFEQRVHEVIEQIKANKKFVSMECRFKGFDYAVMASNGAMNLITRNSETAFLSKYLRCYGGKGEYEGYRIGRLLRNIRFTAHGYVDEPANPQSIIFKQDKNDVSAKFDKTNPLILKDGVYSLQMPKASKDNLNKEFDNMNELEQKVAELTAQINTLTASLEAAKAENEKLVSELKSVSEAKSSLDEELKVIRANEKKAKRVAFLVEGGVEKEVAETKVAAFENLSDDQFTLVANDVIEAAKKDKELKEAKEKAKREAEAEAKKKAEDEAKKKADDEAKAALDKKPEDIVIPQDDDSEDMKKTRASISDLFGQMLQAKANKNKKN
jgi:hypothetical protein